MKVEGLAPGHTPSASKGGIESHYLQLLLLCPFQNGRKEEKRMRADNKEERRYSREKGGTLLGQDPMLLCKLQGGPGKARSLCRAWWGRQDLPAGWGMRHVGRHGFCNQDLAKAA